MKNKTFMLMAVIIAVGTMGCDKHLEPVKDAMPVVNTNSLAPAMEGVREIATNAWQMTKETATNAMANLKEGTTNAWANVKESVLSAKDYTYDKKDAFIAKASSDLDALDEKIKELSDKVAAGGESMKADAKAKLQELRDRRAVSAQKLDAVKNSSDSNWEDVKTGFKKSYDDVKASLNDAWQWLTDKVGR